VEAQELLEVPAPARISAQVQPDVSLDTNPSTDPLSTWASGLNTVMVIL
jgi:hypothetical protein